MKLSDLIFENEYTETNTDMDLEIIAITTDPYEVCEGTLFILIKSPTEPLHFPTLPTAILTCDTDSVYDTPFIKAKNIRAEAAIVYSRFYDIDYSKFKIIGVTGTNGKTSTATFIERILVSNGYTVGSIGTGHITCNGKELSEFGYSMTTPDPWILYPAIKQMENAGCNVIIMEVSSHALVLNKVEPIVFDYGLFTNLSSEHLDFHKSMADYLNAKRKLMKQSKTVVINIDDYYGRQLVKEYYNRKLTVGILWRGDVYLTDITNRGFDGLSYIYHATGFSFKINLCCAGTFNLYNTMMAIAVSIDMGIAPCEAKKALSEAISVNGRYEIIKKDITVIIDYAHTEAAFQNILANISSTKTGRQKLTVVFGCGGDRDRDKRPKMAAAAEKYADTIIITSDNSRTEDPLKIIEDIKRGLIKTKHIVIPDRKKAIESAISNAKNGDIIAILGKGCEKYNIDKNGYHAFDEKKIVLKAFEKRESTV